MTRVLLTGRTGFVGSAVARVLLREANIEATMMERAGGIERGERRVIADLSDPQSLMSATADVDVIVHAAGYLGRDPERQREVNVDGTAALVRAAEGNGVRRIVSLSTTAVYGSGPHRGVEVGQVEPKPESSLSASRLEAEGLLRAGDCVVRPNLLYGPGDRVVIPSIIGLFDRLGMLINDGAALVSVTHVDDLAAVMVAAALSEEEEVPRIVHAVPRRPERIRDVIAELRRTLGRPETKGSCSLDDAIDAMSATGFSRHQLNMIGMDDWYDGTTAQRLAGTEARPFALDEHDVAWYKTVGEHR